MQIKSVTPAERHWSTMLRTAEGGQPITINVTLAAPTSSPPEAPAKDSPGQLLPLLAKGTALGATYTGGNWLLSNVNAVTPEQLAGTFGRLHLVNDPGLAHAQAQRILDFTQSRGVNSVLIGAVAGTWMAVAVDAVRPAWPLWTKLAIGAATAAAVAALLYFGLADKPVRPPALRPPTVRR